MSLQLSPTERQNAQAQLENYAAAQPAFTALAQNDGDLEASFSELIAAAAGSTTYNETERDSLRAAFLRTLQKEICGDDSFRTKIEKYNKKPTEAVLLAEAIAYVVEAVAFPIMTPAIATIAVLWILKLGLRTFCDYTEQPPS